MFSVHRKLQPDIVLFLYNTCQALSTGALPWIHNIYIMAVLRGVTGYCNGGQDIGDHDNINTSCNAYCLVKGVSKVTLGKTFDRNESGDASRPTYLRHHYIIEQVLLPATFHHEKCPCNVYPL